MVYFWASASACKNKKSIHVFFSIKKKHQKMDILFYWILIRSSSVWGKGVNGYISIFPREKVLQTFLKFTIIDNKKPTFVQRYSDLEDPFVKWKFLNQKTKHEKIIWKPNYLGNCISVCHLTCHTKLNQVCNNME